MKHLCKTCIILVAAMAFAACTEEPEIDPGYAPTSDDELCLQIGGDSAETKANASGISRISLQNIDLSEETGIEGFTLTEEVTSLDDMYFGQPATKGTPVYTENITSLIEALGVTAYTSDGNEWGGEVPFTYKSGNIWSYKYEGETLPDPLRVFVKAPMSMDGVDGDVDYSYTDKTIEFDYTSPTSTDSNDAVAQKDLLFSVQDIDSEDPNSNKVLLYHVLTGVKFKLGTVGTNHLTITSIDKIEFSGLKNSGHCIVTPNYTAGTNTSDGDPSNAGGDAATKSAACSLWNLDETTATFSQVFSTDEQGVNMTTATGHYSYPESISGSNGTATVNNVIDAKATKTFMFIPQDLTEDVKLTITFTYQDGTGTGAITSTGKTTIDFGTKMMESANAKDGVYSWKAGELRTYTITIGDRVDVTIEDEVNKAGEDDHTKSDLRIANTGTAISYMRVAVIGNWFYVPKNDEDDTVVAITPCELTSHKSAIRTDYWIEGEDGYYYYKYPVPGGVTISAAHTLFDKVTFSAEYDAKPYNRCELQIVIPVQAVRASQVETAWGGIKVKGSTSTNVVDQLSKEFQDQ